MRGSGAPVLYRQMRVVGWLCTISLGVFLAWPAVRRGVVSPVPGPVVSAAPEPGMGNAWSDPGNPVTLRFQGKRLDLWSLQPVTHPSPPRVTNTGWVRNEIDSFILSVLAKKDLAPAPEASRRVLIRRTAFGLTGLPPSPEEVAAFEQDPAPDAWERVVDRLLASRAYAEHQARMWLDVVRYSDSNGFDYDEFRPYAWRFRDYVVRAFSQDKPYDRFVLEQLAGDELVEGAARSAEDQDCLTASGFLRIGPYDNSAVKFGEEDRCRAQVMFDVVETTGAAFFGMNLSCCRCHDHKTDPLLQEDYYRLRAVFEATQPDDSILLDMEPRYSMIHQEEQALASRKAAVAAVVEAVATRVEAAKLLAQPAGDQLIWTDSKMKHDPANKQKVRSIRRAIKPADSEIEAAFTPAEKEARTRAEQAVTELEGKRTPYQPVYAVRDAPGPVPETYLLRQGDFLEPGNVVAAGVPVALDPHPLKPQPSVRKGSSGRRLALAEWLFSEANPLTGRVMVNRLWQSHFGRGIAAMPNDFGYSGAPPTHPELLDWLAGRFRKEGWSIKKMHRLILRSAAYRQGVASGPEAAAWFAGQAPRRAGAEAVRDSMLRVAGQLQECEGGPPRWPPLPQEVIATSPGALIDNPERTRGWYPSPPEALMVRSLYLIQKRSLRVPLLEAFDLPESNQSCGNRAVSTVAPQALTLLNGSFTGSMAEAFAGRLRGMAGAADEQIRLAFALALQRQPEAAELDSCRAFLAAHSLPEFCRVLFNLNEFIYID